jgi:hypothetical protein
MMKFKQMVDGRFPMPQYKNSFFWSRANTARRTEWHDSLVERRRRNERDPRDPRANSAADSIGRWQPKGFINLALEKGYKLGFQKGLRSHLDPPELRQRVGHRKHARGDHGRATQAARLCIDRADSGRRAQRTAPKGDVFSTNEMPNLHVKLSGTTKLARVAIVKDNQYVYSIQPNSAAVEFSWRDNVPSKGKQSYYYVRGEQEDGEPVWASPMWITYTGN